VKQIYQPDQESMEGEDSDLVEVTGETKDNDHLISSKDEISVLDQLYTDEPLPNDDCEPDKQSEGNEFETMNELSKILEELENIKRRVYEIEKIIKNKPL